MELSDTDAVQMAADQLIPMWQQEKRKFDRIDRWARWDHDRPHRPRSATREYRELSARSQAPWGALIITSITQTLYVEGYRRPEAPEDAEAWRIWQANGMDARQVALHAAIFTYGLAYGSVLPGVTLSGETMPKMRGVSPREMVALYEDPANDEWPEAAMRIRGIGGTQRTPRSWNVDVVDDQSVHHLTIGSIGDVPTYRSQEMHDAGCTPIVRYTNRFDLEGRCAGEVEPFIPILGRIDQTVFDRLVVQRFASWIVRTIAGMDLSKTAEQASTTSDQTVTIAQVLLQLQAQDILTAPDKDTKFGSLPATPLDGFIKGEERDLTDLSALSQTPAFELLGGMANMSAEALNAAKDSQTAKSDQAKHSIGESHEQLLRLGEHFAGNAEGATDYMAEVRWADTSLRSIAQSVDAFGKMATMLGYPPELLWPKVPGFTKQDVDEARRYVEEHGGIEAVLKALAEAPAPTAA